jgi:DNA-binding GntR family transcriptional regulator
MNAPLPLQRPQLLTEVARERIRDAIVSGELKLGEQMSEAQLAARMGISKTPVREALLRLQGDGLVQIHPQRGSFVFRLDAVQVGQLCRYRAMIECAALREAMAERPAELLGEMARRVGEMRKAERARDLRALARIDMDFHWQFLAHCSNAYLGEGYAIVRWQLTALRYRSPIANAVGSHQVLVDAVEDGDAEVAVALLNGHVLENEPRYIAANDVD